MSTTLPHLVIYTPDTPIQRQQTTPISPQKPHSLNQLPSQFLPSILPARTFATHLLTSFRDVTSLLFTTTPALVLIECEGGEDQSRKASKDIVKRIRYGNGGASGVGVGEAGGSNGKRVFVVLWSKRAFLDARERYYWTSKGVNMVTSDLTNLLQILNIVQYLHNSNSSSDANKINGSNGMLFLTPSGSTTNSRQSSPEKHELGSKKSGLNDCSFGCPYCGVAFTLQKLHVHVPHYHSQESEGTVCTVCEQVVPSLGQHLRESHPLQESSFYVPSIFTEKMVSSTNSFFEPLKSFGSLKYLNNSKEERLKDSENKKRGVGRLPVFVLVVCRRKSDGRFLMIDEVSSQGWYLPGGRVEQGEDLMLAAIREAKEESGIDVEIKGLLRTEYTPSRHGFRLRVVYYAEPISESAIPKSLPDHRSSGACWVTPEQLEQTASNGNEGFSATSLPLRGPEPVDWVNYILEEGAIWPLRILSKEKDSIVIIEDPWLKQAKLVDIASKKQLKLIEATGNNTKQTSRRSRYEEASQSESDEPFVLRQEEEESSGDTVRGHFTTTETETENIMTSTEKNKQNGDDSYEFSEDQSTGTTGSTKKKLIEITFVGNDTSETDAFDWVNKESTKNAREKSKYSNKMNRIDTSGSERERKER